MTPAGAVYVWWARLADVRPGLRDLLDDGELARMAAYHRRADADRFLLGVSVTRLVAARETGVAPQAVAVHRRCETCGRPHGRVCLPRSGLHISVAHSGDLVGVAVSAEGRVGLDVEISNHRSNALDLARQALTDPELAELAGISEEARAAGFMRYWVRKEAVLKLSGDGIGKLQTVTVSAPQEPAAVRAWPARPELVDRIWMHDLAPGTGHLATVAVEGVTQPRLIEADAAEILAQASSRPTSTSPGQARPIK